MKLNAAQLISSLIARTERASETVSNYRKLSPAQLNAKLSPQSWSILECLEHLNLYGDFYLVELEKRILAASPVNPPASFRSGLIGNYFANLMIAKPGMKKMKSPADKDPVHSELLETTIERFLKQQEQLLRLLEQARKVDLTKVKTAISLTPLIRLRLGDTFRFFVYHIERHVAQAERLR